MGSDHFCFFGEGVVGEDVQLFGLGLEVDEGEWGKIILCSPVGQGHENSAMDALLGEVVMGF